MALHLEGGKNMARDKTFEWRNQPHLIASYHLDKAIPKKSEVTLGPNEVCIVLENGRIVGAATQTRMEVNPKVGSLKRIFGKRNPRRAFLFAHTGPHDVLMSVKGRTQDGHVVNSLVVVRVELEREEVARLLHLITPKRTTIATADLTNQLIHEAETLVNQQITSHMTLEALRSDAMLADDLEATIASGLRAPMAALGLRLRGAYASWDETEHEKVLNMRQDLEVFREKDTILDEKQSLEAQRILNNRLKEIELNHNLRIAEMSAVARAQIGSQLAQLEAQKELDQARWDTIRAQQLRVAEHENELAAIKRRETLEVGKDEIELMRLNLETEALRHQANDERLDAGLRHEKAAQLQRLEIQRAEAEQSLEIQRQAFELEDDKARASFEREQTSADADQQRTMELFSEVQKRKMERKAQEADREQERLSASQAGSDKIVDTLAQIAAGSKDSEVAMEALKQLGNLRQSDVQAQSDAYVEGSTSDDDEPKKT